MGIYLNKDATFDNLQVQRCERTDGAFLLVGKIRLEKEKPSFILKPSSSNKPEWDGAQAKEFCDKLENASSLYQMNKEGANNIGDNRCHLCIHVIVGPLEGQSRSGEYYMDTSTVRVHGFMGDMLEDLDNNGKYSHILQGSAPRAGYWWQVVFFPRMCEKYFEAKLNDGHMFRHYDNSTTSSIRGSINVILSREEPLTQSDYPRKSEIYREILDNQTHTDVVLVARSGAEFACNKTILAAHSPVFAAMFETEMEEAKTNKIDMDDMSEDAVRALLAYLYCSDMKVPLENSAIALELLQAGHKYDIAHLEEDMRKIFERKPTAWYSAEVALELFLFVRRLAGVECDDLKMTVFDALKLKLADMTIGSLKELIKDKDQFQGLDVDLLFDVLKISCLKTGRSKKAD